MQRNIWFGDFSEDLREVLLEVTRLIYVKAKSVPVLRAAPLTRIGADDVEPYTFLTSTLRGSEWSSFCRLVYKREMYIIFQVTQFLYPFVVIKQNGAVVASTLLFYHITSTFPLAALRTFEVGNIRTSASQNIRSSKFV
jgi:hypothetical protein